MILSGEKTEEYREVKPYYDSRFRRLFDMDESNNPTGLAIRAAVYHSRTSPPMRFNPARKVNKSSPT